ncbi:hypothetical protein G3N55_01445 [Dissulfurirhabdus thermomarina]|uniref:6-bladed beta-propeller n=2 Tax=Dissulfurirhabdus thermomarina TaxID=1765737 RepID=A0A6N9TKB3_DISTH|nr:NHL repeat-containing protein [Dissulfurirhabdus thermomarina]NDY41518.1 hypothetical protein [Dissulfurirhabdus thermomarina]NMX22963.1 hypothetical protein [Dissulfurirhabdus thermomarina]
MPGHPRPAGPFGVRRGYVKACACAFPALLALLACPPAAARAAHAGPPRLVRRIAAPCPGPQAVAFHGGRLLVACRGQNTVAVLDTDGRLLERRPFTPHPGADPVDLAVDPAGRVYVADAAGLSVWMRDPAGRPAPFPARGGPAPGLPLAVAVGGGNLLVADGAGRTVQVFAPRGDALLEVGGPGNGPARLRRPVSVLQAPDGRILVGDAGLGKVAVFTCNGRFAYFFDDPAGGPLEIPGAMALDGRRRFHVLDMKRRRIYLYDFMGRRLGAYGTDAWAEGGPGRPTDLAADPGTGEIYVTDAAGGGRILVWEEDQR